MPLPRLLNADRIAILSEPGDRNAVLDVAARLLGDAVPDATAAIGASLHAREALASTAIGQGVAMPHGHCDDVHEARAAFMRLSPPVDFGADDGQPVDLVVALVVPEPPSQQLELLAEVASRFENPAFRRGLRAAPDLGELRRFLLDASRHEAFRGAIA